MSQAKDIVIAILALICGFQWILLHEGQPSFVFNTQPVWVGMSPQLSPLIEFKDLDTIVIHRPPEKWFTVSCIEWAETYVRPNYENKACWPTNEKGKIIPPPLMGMKFTWSDKEQ